MRSASMPGNFGCPIDRVGLLGFQEQVPYRNRPATANHGRTGEGGIRAARVRNRRPRRRVDDVVGILLARLGLLRIEAHGMVADDHARLGIDQERHARMAAHEVGIRQVIVNDVGDHAQEQRRISAGLDGNPLVGLRRRGGIVRVDRHHMSAGLLCIEEGEAVGQTGLAVIRAHRQDELGTRPVTCLGSAHGIPGAKPHRGIEAIANADVDAVKATGLGTQHGSQEAKVGLGGGDDHDGIAAVRILGLLDEVTDLVKRLIPANGLELSRTTLADALERGLYAPLSVDVGDFRDSL